MRLLPLLAVIVYLIPSLVAYNAQIQHNGRSDAGSVALLEARDESTDNMTPTSTASNDEATTTTTSLSTTTDSSTSTSTTSAPTSTGTASSNQSTTFDGGCTTHATVLYTNPRR